MTQWFNNLDVKLQAAIIASVVTLIGIFIKEVGIRLFFVFRDKRQQEEDVFRKYAEPLAKSAESLFWRLNEVFNVPGRAHFLKKDDIKTTFEEYKFLSTIYRLSALLGWLRALRSEQSFIRHRKKSVHKKIGSAIAEFESALADGPHVENECYKRLADLWDIPIQSEPLRTELAVGNGALIKKRLHEHQAELATELDESKKLILCNDCADFLTRKSNTNAIADEVIRETVNQAAWKMSIRESWLYRDWQAGIGDLMLKESDSEARKYNVIGFKDFEAKHFSDDKEIKKWINRVARIFRDLDVTIDDQQDFRVRQIKATFITVAKIIVSISESGLHTTPFSKTTIDKALTISVPDAKQRRR